MVRSLRALSLALAVAAALLAGCTSAVLITTVGGAAALEAPQSPNKDIG
jgi:hypothetical protein